MIGKQQMQGFREFQVGNAQAWYYPADKAIVLWECFFYDDFRKHPLVTDTNMRNLWKGFEQWLLDRFPETSLLATTMHDPIAATPAEYQTFLQALGYARIAKTAFGKHINTS